MTESWVILVDMQFQFSASSSSTSLPMSSADLLQKLPKDPLPPNSLSNGAGGSENKDATGSGSAERPYIQSQLSMEVTKGEQLTELLDSWYNNPQAQDIAGVVTNAIYMC